MLEIKSKARKNVGIGENAMIDVECEFLGTGTSYGVPAIGCRCPVCASDNPKNKRLRSSVFLTVKQAGAADVRLLVDVTPDLRSQALRAGIAGLDAVLLTHAHADHTHGIDDLRAFYWHGGRKEIPLYGYPECLAALRRRFDYLFDLEYEYRGIARTRPIPFDLMPFDVLGVEVTPIPLVHGSMRVAAFRLGDFAYITDTNLIPDSSVEKLAGVRLLVIDALRRVPHPTHLSLPEALAICERIGVERAFFTHINHDLDHDAVDAELPEWASLGYDTLRVALEGGRARVLGDRLAPEERRK